jgi:phage terminase small subunit
MPLTEKQELFVQEYLIDFNATSAAKRAGYSARTAAEQGYQLLKKTEIQEALTAAKNARQERTKVDQDWVIKRLKAIADADIRKVCTWNAGGLTPLDSNELSWEDAYIIDSIILKETIKDNPGGDDIILNREKWVNIAKVKDKRGALDQLCKHLDMYKNGQQTSDGNALESLINAIILSKND